MLNYFRGITLENLELSHDQEGMAFTAKLAEESHCYLYSKRIALNEIENLSDAAEMSVVLYSNLASLSLAIIFYGDEGLRLNGEIVPCNQSQKIQIPAGALCVAFGIRFYGESCGLVYDLLCGSERFINEAIKQHGSFNGLTENKYEFEAGGADFNYHQPLIILETIFCDTEKDKQILDRYKTFLNGLFVSVLNQQYRNFIWYIFVSADKEYQIQAFLNWINKSKIGSRIKLITYDHPENGYGFEDDDHIDRSRRPNTSLEERRQALTEMIVKESDVTFEKFDYVVRLGLDDDDFISTNYLNEISLCVIDSYEKNEPEEKYRIFGFPNIGCAYYRYDGSVDLDKVSMSRAMTGAKFSVAKHALPMSPFAISEDFTQWTSNHNKNVTYHKVSNNKPGFFYNRHGQNFSNQSKKYFYEKEYESTSYRTQSEFYRKEVMECKVKSPEVYDSSTEDKYDVSLLLLSSKRSSHHAFVEGLLKNRKSYYDNDCLFINGEYIATKTVQEDSGDNETNVYALSLERDFTLNQILDNEKIHEMLETRATVRKNVLYLRDPLNTAASTFNIYDKVSDNPSFNFKFVEKNIEHYLNLVESYLSMQDKSDLIFIYSNHFWSDSSYQQKKLEEMGLPEAEYTTKMSFYGGGGNSFFGNKKEVTSNDLVTRFKKYIDNDEFMSLIDNERFYAISASMLTFVNDEYLLDELNTTLATQYSICV